MAKQPEDKSTKDILQHLTLPPSTTTRTFISAYGPKLKTPLHFHLPSRTKQSFKAECDVNTIMGRYAKSGVLPQGGRPKQYINAGALEFQEAMQLIVEAQTAFDQLPAATRERFGNNPAGLLAFLEDPGNRAEAIKLGLVPPPAPELVPAAIAAPAGSKPAQTPPGTGGV